MIRLLSQPRSQANSLLSPPGSAWCFRPICKVGGGWNMLYFYPCLWTWSNLTHIFVSGLGNQPPTIVSNDFCALRKPFFQALMEDIPEDKEKETEQQKKARHLRTLQTAQLRQLGWNTWRKGGGFLSTLLNLKSRKSHGAYWGIWDPICKRHGQSGLTKTLIDTFCIFLLWRFWMWWNANGWIWQWLWV